MSNKATQPVEEPEVDEESDDYDDIEVMMIVRIHGRDLY